MNIQLTDEEISLVQDLVKRRIDELGPEIHHTDSRDYRDALEELRDKLLSLRSHLPQVAV